MQYIESQSYSWHVNNNSSGVLSTLTNNINQTSSLVRTLTLFIPNVLLIIALMSSLIALEPTTIGFVVIMMSIFYYSSFKLNSFKLVLNGRQRILYNREMIGWIQAMLQSIKTIKIENISKIFLDKISTSNKIYRESIVKK